MYWVQMWQSWFPGSSTAVTNNDENRILGDVTEQEAKMIVEQELDFPVPEFFYLPNGMKFENVRIDEEAQYARLQYAYNEAAVYLSISGSKIDGSESLAPNISEKDNISVETLNGEISITIIEDRTGNEGTTIYRSRWIYHNCQYELNGLLNKKEIIKILEKMRYTL